MDGISWADLERDEQRAIAILGAGLSIELCSPLALLALGRLGSDHRVSFDGCCTQFAKRCRFEACRWVSGSAPVDHDRGWGCQAQSS